MKGSKVQVTSFSRLDALFRKGATREAKGNSTYYRRLSVISSFCEPTPSQQTPLALLSTTQNTNSMRVDGVKSREKLCSSLGGALFSISQPRRIFCGTGQEWKVQTLLHQARAGRLAK
jgi:hypothetical protein